MNRIDNRRTDMIDDRLDPSWELLLIIRPIGHHCVICRFYSATVGVSEHDDELCTKHSCRELGAPQFHRGHDIPCDADHKEITDPLIKEGFHWYTRIRTPEHNRDG